jgi:hypothetical protein
MAKRLPFKAIEGNFINLLTKNINHHMCKYVHLLAMKVVRSIGSLALALLVLMASSHFFVDMHLCGDKVKAVSFLSEADGCGHAKLPPCHQKLMKDCCDNEQIEHAAQDVKKEVVSVQLPTPTSIDLLHHTLVLAEFIPSVEPTRLHNTPYDPPLRAVDRNVLHAIFLI